MLRLVEETENGGASLRRSKRERERELKRRSLKTKNKEGLESRVAIIESEKFVSRQDWDG